MKLLQQVCIPEYIIQIKLSEKRRAKYYKKKKDGSWYPRNLPKTHRQKLADGVYKFSKSFHVLDENNEKLLANPRAVGTPKYQKLSGNDIASGYATPHIRAKIVNGLKDFYRPFVAEMSPITDFPIWVDWHLYTTIPNRLFDLSNFWFYYKYFEDCLFEWRIQDPDSLKIIAFQSEEEAKKKLSKKKGWKLLPPVIPDDNIKFVTKPGTAPILYPIHKWEDRKFIFKFYNDDRTCLKQHKFYQ